MDDLRLVEETLGMPLEKAQGRLVRVTTPKGIQADGLLAGFLRDGHGDYVVIVAFDASPVFEAVHPSCVRFLS